MKILIAFCLLFTSLEGHNQNSSLTFHTSKGRTIQAKEFESFVANKMQLLEIPALSFAIINEGKIVYWKTITNNNKDSHFLKKTITRITRTVTF